MEHDEDSDRRDIDKKRFRFDATFNIAHIIATGAMVIGLFNWGGSVNTALAEQKIVNHVNERDRIELMQALREMNRKLDEIKSSGNR